MALTRADHKAHVAVADVPGRLQWQRSCQLACRNQCGRLVGEGVGACWRIDDDLAGGCGGEASGVGDDVIYCVGGYRAGVELDLVDRCSVEAAPRWWRRGRVVHSINMAAKETMLEELGETLTHVVTHMATKENIGNMHER